MRRFGRTGWQVSEIGFGMWGMGGWTGSDDEESARALDRAIALGCNFFDTAWVYGLGRSERLLGEALRRSSASVNPVSINLRSATNPKSRACSSIFTTTIGGRISAHGSGTAAE